MAAFLFMSARPILGHFLPFLMVFVKTTRNSGSKFCPGGNFQFSTDFHEYALNMTSYHVTEAING